jgi:hypothetical protein
MQGTRSLTKSKAQSHIVTDGLGNDIIKGGAAAVGAFGVGAVGIWAIASLFSGMMAAGGPLSLVKSWFMAVGGF